MSQGQRGKWVRVAFAGLGIVLSFGTIGCMGDKDQPPDKYGAKGTLPPPGLPNTPTLPGMRGSGLGTTGQQPMGNQFGAAGVQPGAGNRGVNPPTGNNFGAQPGFGTTTGAGMNHGANTLVPSAAPADAMGTGGVQPAAGFGNPTAPQLNQLSPMPPGPPDATGFGGDIVPPTPPVNPGLQPAPGGFGGQ